MSAAPGSGERGRFLCRVAYDGGAFHGFARQPGGIASVQGTLEEGLSRLYGEPIRVTGAGRTDVGVHAECQAIHFDAPVRIPPERIPYALNRLLPEALAVRGAWRVRDRFHARRDALWKRYRYLIWRDPLPHPLWRGRAWHLPGPLDLEAMRRAARLLEGEHDFRSFQVAGRPVRSARRHLRRLEVGAAGPFLWIWAEADGFLYKMVRSLVGTLVEVGRGGLAADGVAAILAAQDRRRAGPTAPGCGLSLHWVEYGGALPPAVRSAWHDAGGEGGGGDGRDPLLTVLFSLR